MENLYSITEELQLIATLAEEEEFTPEMEERLVIAQAQLASKAGGYAHFITNLNAQVAFAKSELVRIKKYQERKQTAIDRLKASLLSAVLSFGGEQRNGVRLIETDTFRISTRRSPAVVMSDESAIPNDYYTTTVTVKGMAKEDAERLVMMLNNSKVICAGTADNFDISSAEAKSVISATKIKEANQAGTEVPGAKYDEERYGLAIK